jgi:Na+:H+ antiporter, NhaA family
MTPHGPSIQKQFINPVKVLAEDGRLSGILLVAATVFSLLCSNLDGAAGYLKIWHTEIGPPFIARSVVHWINDALMPVFFLLVGIEIKREMRSGELSDLRKAMLPVVAAVGGMIVPALIYFIFNAGNTETVHGWAIPTATDIAFSLGVISLLGKRVPFAIRIFLLALAIIDDLGAILIIAVFYSSALHGTMLLAAAAVLIFLLVMNSLKFRHATIYILPGIFLWYFVLKSGIHPTIAGVLFAFAIPSSLGHMLEERLMKVVYFLILPFFALANTAIPLSSDVVSNLVSPLSLGIILGMMIGKPTGIVLFTFVLVRSGAGAMLHRISWKQMTGTGLVAGIGFTMSIFIASLSFTADVLSDTSKLAILGGSLLSAIGGFLLLKSSLRDKVKYPAEG